MPRKLKRDAARPRSKQPRSGRVAGRTRKTEPTADIEFEDKQSTQFGYALRGLFLTRIEEDAEAREKVLATLFRDVYQANLKCFPIYMGKRWRAMVNRSRQMWNEDHPGRDWGERDDETFSHWEALGHAEEFYPELVSLRESIHKWSIDCRLDIDWIREEAFKTVRGYSLGWVKPYTWRNDYGAIGPPVRVRAEEVLAGRVPGFTPYRPSIETQRAYLEKRRSELESYLSAHSIIRLLCEKDVAFRSTLNAFVKNATSSLKTYYCEAVSRLYATKGNKRIGRIPDAARERDIRWAVMYHINERDCDQIEQAEKQTGQFFSQDAIKRAVQRTLRGLNLQRRPGRPNLRKHSSR